MKTDVSIITAWGGIYGTGHFRRMLLLAVHLAEKYNLSVEICGNGLPAAEYADSGIIFTEFVNSKTRLIIHDFRDSDIEKIISLMEIAPVITIDDLGSGRKAAAAAIDLLPNAEFSGSYDPSMFLYGYDFFKNLFYIDTQIPRSYDFLYYYATGENSHLDLVRKFVKNRSLLVLRDSKLYEDISGCLNLLEFPYSEAYFRCEYVITHFGILPYEALLCGCIPVFLNISEYHSMLTKKEPLFTDMPDIGTYDNPLSGSKDIVSLLQFKRESADAADVRKHITENLDIFSKMIFLYL